MAIVRMSNIPSTSLVNVLWSAFNGAFITASLSDAAREEKRIVAGNAEKDISMGKEVLTKGTYENQTHESGYYFTRTKVDDECYNYVDVTGSLDAFFCTDPDGGIRPSINIKYKKDSCICKSEHIVERSAIVSFGDEFSSTVQGVRREVVGVAPVVSFGGNDYIWLNAEECESADSEVMQLVSLELLSQAPPFGQTTNYSDAKELLDHVDRTVFKNATAEELALVVPTKLEDDDSFENEAYAPEKLPECLIGLYLSGSINVDVCKRALSIVMDIKVDEKTFENLLLDVSSKRIAELSNEKVSILAEKQEPLVQQSEKNIILASAAPSLATIDELCEKFGGAFETADLSIEARDNGAYKNEKTSSGYYFTRFGAGNRYAYVDCGGIVDYYFSSAPDSGLRPEIFIEFDPSDLKKVKMVKRIAIIKRGKTSDCHDYVEKERLVVGEAPTIKYGGNDYIWMNMEECKSGQSVAMELVSLSLIDKAVPLDRNGETSDYADALEYHAQMDRCVYQKASPQELARIIPVKLKTEDGGDYQSSTFAFDKKIPFLLKFAAYGIVSFESLKQAILLIKDKTALQDTDLIDGFLNVVKQRNGESGKADADEFLSQMQMYLGKQIKK